MASIVRIKDLYNIPERKCNSNNQSIKGASYAFALNSLRNMIGPKGNANNSFPFQKIFKLKLSSWKNPYSIATNHNNLVTNSPMNGAGPTDTNVIRGTILEDQRRKAAIYNFIKMIH